MPGLAPLISPLSPDAFLSEKWPKTPFVTHSLKTIGAIQQLPFLESLEALLKSWPDQVRAQLPDARDESSEIHVSSDDARKLFQNKMALLFNNVEKLSPLLQNWLQELQDDLGLSGLTYGRCMAYATPDGQGTAAHFDQNVNFVVQLHGTKRWWLAPNTTVENPTARHALTDDLDPELASYTQIEMPREMPKENRVQFDLKPGSMLFVPRGYWHSTESEGHSLALNFTLSQPTWADLVSLALRARLMQSPEWRELADGVSSKNSIRRQKAHDELDRLFAEMPELSAFSAGDFIEPIGDDD